MKIAVFQGFGVHWFFLMEDRGKGWALINSKPVRFGSPRVAGQWVKDHHPTAEITFKREHHVPGTTRNSAVREYDVPL